MKRITLLTPKGSTRECSFRQNWSSKHLTTSWQRLWSFRTSELNNYKTTRSFPTECEPCSGWSEWPWSLLPTRTVRWMLTLRNHWRKLAKLFHLTLVTSWSLRDELQKQIKQSVWMLWTMGKSTPFTHEGWPVTVTSQQGKVCYIQGRNPGVNRA